MDDIKDSDVASFHLKLLLNILSTETHPFTKLVIERNLSSQEYNQLFDLLNELDKTYKTQKEEGLLDYLPLLIHFAGMLTEKLSPKETIEALKKEGMYEELMAELLHVIDKEGFE